MIKDIQKQLLEMNVNEYTEMKGKLTYLSWSNAWKEFIKISPEATYKILKNDLGLPYFGNPQHGYMVFTEVTAEGLTHEMWLPVMDFKNKSMLVPTTFDVNKAIMRCLTKNLAMFGLGLYIYSGEDLPEIPKSAAEIAKEEAAAKAERDGVIAACKEKQEATGVTDEQLKNAYGLPLEELSLEYLRKASIDLGKKLKKMNNATK